MISLNKSNNKIQKRKNIVSTSYFKEFYRQGLKKI